MNNGGELEVEYGFNLPKPTFSAILPQSIIPGRRYNLELTTEPCQIALALDFHEKPNFLLS
jgi:hypothetical protein